MDKESEKTNPKTAEIILATARNYVDCPVCFHTMMPPIYQCCNGHVICFNCIDKIDKCSECRVSLPKSLKIRNIALENISSNWPVDCSNKNDGCVDKLSVGSLKDHLQVCPYTSFNFCPLILGLMSCKFQVNDFTVLSHLEMSHSVIKPLVITSMEIQVLIRCMLCKGYFSIDGIALSNPPESQNIRLKFRIASPAKEVALEWSGYVRPYRKFRETNIINSFRIPYESLKELWDSADRVEETMWVYVSVWERAGYSQENEVLEEVHLLYQNSTRQSVSQVAGQSHIAGPSQVAVSTQELWDSISDFAVDFDFE